MKVRTRISLSALSLLIAAPTWAFEMAENLTPSDDPSGDELSYRVNHPSAGGNVYFSNKSNQNGVCRALGFEKAAIGSAESSGAIVGPTLIVNDAGTVTGGEVVTSTTGLWFTSIICVNKLSQPLIQTFMRENPTHPTSNAYFSSRSSLTGVCKVLGYQGGGAGAAEHSGSVVPPVLIIDSTGKIEGAEEINNRYGFWISRISCWNSTSTALNPVPRP